MPADEPIVKACACGGVIVAIADTSTSIERAVRDHQAKARHLIWRQNGGLDQIERKLDAYEGRLYRTA
jgi:hypothetical protein